MLILNWKHRKGRSLLAALLGLAFIGTTPLLAACQSFWEPVQQLLNPQEIALDQLLEQSWQGYKKRFIQQDGRVIDHKAGGISTSEGQSYALLRAVWMNDPQTFNQVWSWTQNNLQVRGDHLFAWKWGQQSTKSPGANGPKAPEGPAKWGPIDSTAASDADQDIALALLMAHRKWQDPS